MSLIIHDPGKGLGPNNQGTNSIALGRFKFLGLIAPKMWSNSFLSLKSRGLQGMNLGFTYKN